MAIFTNSNAVRIEGNVKAKFKGFKAIEITGKQPMIKVVFETEGGTKLDYVLGSSVDLQKLNDLLKAVGKAPVANISQVDCPIEGGMIPADWDKTFIVESYYPVKTTKDASGKVVTSVSNFAAIKSIIGLDQSATATPSVGAPSIPTL